jgi:hypothetical protein
MHPNSTQTRRLARRQCIRGYTVAVMASSTSRLSAGRGSVIGWTRFTAICRRRLPNFREAIRIAWIRARRTLPHQYLHRFFIEMVRRKVREQRSSPQRKPLRHWPGGDDEPHSANLLGRQRLLQVWCMSTSGHHPVSVRNRSHTTQLHVSMSEVSTHGRAWPRH